MVNKNSDFALAVANLAAAAMASDKSLTMAAAVSAARELLRPADVSAAQIADSVHPDKIQCLIDGTWHVMLRRYIWRKYKLTPAAYREKYGLSADYPFVAPNYARLRSRIAKKNGLGKQRRNRYGR